MIHKIKQPNMAAYKKIKECMWDIRCFLKQI